MDWVDDALRTLNLRHLRIFCRVAEAGTLRGAAVRSGLTQPAVTQAMKALESKFGVGLLERSGRGVRLSTEGRTVHARIEHMLGFLRQMHRWVSDPATFDNRLTIAQLVTLVEIDRHKGYTPAARALGVAVPTVHRAASALFSIAGTALFDRINGVLEPTLAGDEMSRLAGLALKELSLAFEDLDDLSGQATGTIALGAIPLARTDILPHVICDFCAASPAVSVEIVESDYERLLRGLRRGELDVILGASRGREASDDVEEHGLFEDELAVFARAGHPLAERRDLTIDDLAA